MLQNYRKAYLWAVGIFTAVIVVFVVTHAAGMIQA